MERLGSGVGVDIGCRLELGRAELSRTGDFTYRFASGLLVRIGASLGLDLGRRESVCARELTVGWRLGAGVDLETMLLLELAWPGFVRIDGLAACLGLIVGVQALTSVEIGKSVSLHDEMKRLDRS